MTSSTVRHEVTDACAQVHCYVHGLDEGESGYLACFECGHLYRTARDLRRAYRRGYWNCMGRWSKPFGVEGWQPTLWERLWRMATVRAKAIRFCQFCSHDF